MNTKQLDEYFRGFLAIGDFASTDISMNGLQVDNDGAEVRKIGFAVDACLETFKRAARAGCNMLFVHHGLYWGKPIALTGTMRGRLDFLLRNNLALYACHLPLDAHPELGNNAGLFRALGGTGLEPFGLYRGVKIGFKGTLATPLTIDEAAIRVLGNAKPLGVYPFGPQKNRTLAAISGGAADEVLQAIDEGVDLYVTGEMKHELYHQVEEAGINMLALGHYATEVFGPKAVMEKTARELNLEVEFIEVPTGL